MTSKKTSVSPKTPSTVQVNHEQDPRHLPPKSPRKPPEPQIVASNLIEEELSEIALKVKYRRVPELSRPSNFKARLLVFLIKSALYVLLIPAMFSGAVIGMSLKLGATWNESFQNVSMVTRTTSESYETYYDLLKLSSHILLNLEETDDLELIAKVVRARSKLSDLNASLDKALADYLEEQVKRNKRRQLNSKEKSTQAITLNDVVTCGIYGALAPLILYLLLSYLLTRYWLNVRARETVEFHKERVKRELLKRTSVRKLVR